MASYKKHRHHQVQQVSKKRKKKASQPMKSSANHASNDYYKDQMRAYAKAMKKILENKESIQNNVRLQIDKIVKIFTKYDCVQLLGSVGLKLMNSIPTIEKKFLSYLSKGTTDVNVDEDCEVIVEYAMNFGLAINNDSTEAPTAKICNDLYESLRSLKTVFGLIDMPTTYDSESLLAWMSHAELISVRGDGYQQHTETVFQELFSPHSPFFERKFGFSTNDLFTFLTTIERRIFCKIGDQYTIFGATVAHDRWLEWMKSKYGDDSDIQVDEMIKDNPDNPILGGFLKDNPDMACPVAPNHICLYPPDDFSSSDKIFWIVPQSQIETNILEALNIGFGDNASFLEENEYKGNILNGPNIFTKPIVKAGGKYYCFTPMLLHRNMFRIAESLIKQDSQYYNEHFQENNDPNSRDNYIERKVKEQLEMFLPNVSFYSSVDYNIVENVQNKRPELDILGVSDEATYVIEVKAHELSYKDRVGIKGLKDKFRDSVTYACTQCERANSFIVSSSNPSFNNHGYAIQIDKSKPIYKIAVTFQHYSFLLGEIKHLKNVGLLSDEHKNTWIVSLFDLMVIADYCKDEAEFIDYLKLRYTINNREIVYNDELELYDGYLNGNLKMTLERNKHVLQILGSTEFFDKDYAGDYDLPLINDD